MDKIILFDIDYTLFDTERFKDSNLLDYALYDEVLEVLDKLKGKVEIGIFSTGEIEFQKEKLKKTLIARHFDEKNVHIFLNKDENIKKILKLYNKMMIFFVDDKLTVLNQAKKINNKIFTIWIIRGPYAKAENSAGNFTPDATVLNLSEIIPIIQKS